MGYSPEPLSSPTDGDPLVSLGLVDPSTGRATETADWKPNDRTPPGATPPTQRNEYGDPIEPQQQPQQPPASDWESDDNPYKKQFRELSSKLTPADPAQDAARNLQTRLAALQQERATAYHNLVNNPNEAERLSPAHAEVLVNSLYSAAASQAQLEADRSALLPTAKRAVADMVAKEFSVGGAKIDPDELVSLNSPGEMRTKAETLRDARRQGNFEQRRAAGTDRAETGSAATRTTREMIEGLSPQQKIALGLRRGD